MPQRPRGYFPGTFFGFGPKPQGAVRSAAEKPIVEKEDKNENDIPEKIEGTVPKRRRTYRRNRRPAARKKAAPDKTAPKPADSGDSGPRKKTPRRAAPRKAASRKTIPRKAVPEKEA
jgi:hypothetical protein